MKKLSIFLAVLFFTSQAFAARCVRFDSTNMTVLYNNVYEDTSKFLGDPHAVINPDLSAVFGVAEKYWKLVDGSIVPKTAQEITTQDAAEAAAILALYRSIATAHMTAESDIDWRAVAAIMIDEINTLRQWTVSFKAEVAAATNLANLQSRVATLPTLTDRTLTQAKTAYENKVDSGAAD